MQLYYKPGACSMAPHILAREANLDVTIDRVDTKEQRTESGADYKTINPKGYVPALGISNGVSLTEVAVILQYLADQKPEAKLIPAAGTLERYRTQEWLNYIATEIHKGFSPIFRATDETRPAAIAALTPKFDYLNKTLEGREFLQGASFTAPDAYLFTVLNWKHAIKLDITPWAALSAYYERLRKRPSVVTAMTEEGLLK